MPSEVIMQVEGHDVLLADRVKQLREIDERLERIQPLVARDGNLYEAWKAVRELRGDLQTMIERAEQEYADF